MNKSKTLQNEAREACDLYRKAEVLCKNFEDFYLVAWCIINELHNDVWGNEVLMQTTELIKNTDAAGKVLSLASSIRDNTENESEYVVIQNKVLNWNHKQ